MRLRLRAVAMTCLTVGLLVAGPQLGATGSDTARGRVAVDQTYRVPASGTFTVRGHGYGHGRGMSQYGANGAALEGLKHERILEFYYPGTSLDTARGKIRVLITSDSEGDDLVVEARRGLALRDRGAGTTYALPRDLGASRWRVAVDDQDRNVVAYYADGAWRSWKPGGSAALEGEGEFRAKGPITLVTPTGTARYRGSLRAAQPSGSTSRNTVNVVSLDDYVQGVVPAEMPASWEPEAVQSQAVAARTYGAWQRAQHGDWSYDICDTTSCQVYRGVAGEHDLGNAAVRATSKQILTYKGSPAFTEFSSSSGGWTAAGSFDYLTAHSDPYDDWSGNYVHDWSVKVSAASIANAYPAVGKLRSIKVTSRDGNGEWQGRVLAMRLVGSKGTVKLSGDDFRWKFGLRSTWFSF